MAQPTTPTPQDANADASTRRQARFEPLAVRAPVSVQRSACLRLRTHLAECRACAVACPTHAINAGAQSLELNVTACTGCGRCQAACPAGALAVDGFAATAQAPRTTQAVVTVDCHRAPQVHGGGLRVPCLGGLSEARLLSLCTGAAAGADTRVVLLDHGLCATCQSGGAEHPAQATLQRVAALMTEAGVPASALPVIQRVTGAGRAAMDPMQLQGRARRGFFGALARPSGEVSRHDCAPATSEASSEREQTIAALQRMVARHGGRMPASLFHRLEVSAACRGHRVCASACPTGALVRYRDDNAERMGIAYDNAACLGCGHCAAVCPEQALQVRWGGGTVGEGRRPLTGFVQRECADCGSRFATKDGESETHCQRCRKSAGLARSAFQTLFGHQPKPPGTGVFFNEELR